MECKYCGHKSLYEKTVVFKNGEENIGRYCCKCDRWQKWVKQLKNIGKTADDYKKEYLSKELATDKQIDFIKKLVRMQ